MIPYNSQWSGGQIDNALGVIINSEVSSSELSVLRNAGTGTGVALKALVLDVDKNCSGVNIFGVSVLRADKAQFPVGSDPEGNPQAGCVFLYYKDEDFYVKSAAGSVRKLVSGKELIVEFTDTDSVTCVHDLGVKYPIVEIVGDDDKTLVGQIYYQNTTTVVVTFSGLQTGKVILRTV